LVARIVEEANREGVPLSEVERKMLYFSETGWTLPNMKEVNEEFDRKYDQDDYERKIAGLIGNFEKRTRAENKQEWDTWTSAVRTFREEDHYLLVMMDLPAGASGVRPPASILKLILTAVVVSAILLTIMYLFVLFRR
jgi:hypothetical protein